MKTRSFKNGDQIPVLGLGTWKSEPGEVIKAVKDAIKVGYRHIDCAAIYGNEVEIGQALKESFEEGIVHRDQLWITSKLWNDSHAPKDVMPALRKTLSDLQLDSLDLYLMHWPVALKKGVYRPESAADLVSLEVLPITETWTAIEHLVDKKLVRHIGVSNFSTKKLKQILNCAKIKPEMNQVEMHPYLQQHALLEFCHLNDIHVTAYAPLGSFDRPASLKADGEAALLSDKIVTEIAEKNNMSPAQLVLAWAIQRGTIVIPKSVNHGRIKQNLDAAGIKVKEADMHRLSTLDKHNRYISGEFWAMKNSSYTIANLWDG